MFSQLPLSLVLAICATFAAADHNVTLHSWSPELRLSPKESWQAVKSVGGRTGHVGGIRGSSHAAAKVEFDFVGTALFWSSYRGPDRGYLRICIDECDDPLQEGSSDGYVLDEYAEEYDVAPTLSWWHTGLGLKNHQVVISNVFDERIGRYPSIAIDAVHYTTVTSNSSHSTTNTTASSYAGANSAGQHMNIGVLVGCTVGAFALLFIFLLYHFIRRRRRARLAPSHYFRETQPTGNGARSPLLKFLPASWAGSPFFSPRSRREITPYQLPPLSPATAHNSTSFGQQDTHLELDTQVESTHLGLESQLESTQLGESTNAHSPGPSPTTPNPESSDVFSPVRSPSSTRQSTFFPPVRSGSVSARVDLIGSPVDPSSEPSSSPLPSSNSRPPSSQRGSLLSPSGSIMRHFQFPPRRIRRRNTAGDITPFELPPLNPNPNNPTSPASPSPIPQRSASVLVQPTNPSTLKTSTRGLPTIVDTFDISIPYASHAEASTAMPFILAGPSPTRGPEEGMPSVLDEPPSPIYEPPRSAKSPVAINITPPTPAMVGPSRPYLQVAVPGMQTGKEQPQQAGPSTTKRRSRKVSALPFPFRRPPTPPPPYAG